MPQPPRAKDETPHGTRSRPDPNIGILFREPYLAFSAEVLRRLNAEGYEDLTASHLIVFQHIDPGGSRLTDLAQRAQMTKPSMAYLVRNLEDAGYVAREPDATDGRASLIVLTERGWRQIEDALDIITDLEAELGAALGADRLEALRGLLSDASEFTSAWRSGS